MSSGKEGALYEQRINDILKRKRLQPPGYHHDPYNNTQPDSVLKYNKKIYGLEVKAHPKATMGSCTIIHDGKKWKIDDSKDESVLQDMLIRAGANIKINNFYGKTVPNIFKRKNLSDEERLEDISIFGNTVLSFDIPKVTATKYYANRDINYIQIKEFGFYYLEKNVGGIGCPKYSLSSVGCEVRLKKEMKRGKVYYRFVAQVRPKGSPPPRSKVNIEKDLTFLMV